MGRVTHGMKGTATYNVWRNMKNRCLNENNPDYGYYGGRGITVCDNWLNSFENFYEDMGIKPEGCSLDRRDNEEGYSSTNCRWVTQQVQVNNRRNNRLITFKEQTKTLTEWSDYLEIPVTTLWHRLDRGLQLNGRPYE